MAKVYITTRGHLEWCEERQQYVAVSDGGYIYSGQIAQAGGVPTKAWTDWAFYNDGTESGSTIIGAKNTNQTLDVDTIYFFRVGIHETAGNKWTNPPIQLQYNHNSGGWNDVNATSLVVQSVASANITDDADTTQRMTAFTYIASNDGIDEVDGRITTGADPNSNGFECLFSIQIISTDVSDADTIELKIIDAVTGDPDTINQTNPTVTVNEGAASQNLSADYLSPGTTLSEPTLAPGSVNLSADYITPGTTLSEPTMAGSYPMGVDYIAPATNLSEPTFSLSYTLPADYLTPGTNLYEPGVILQGAPQNIAADYLTPGTALHEPAVTLAGSLQNIATDYISPVATLYTPTLAGTYLMGVDYLAPATSLSEPTLAPGAVTVSVDFITAGTALSEPQVSLSGAPQNLAADYLSPVTALYEPTTVLSYTLTVDYLSPGTALSEPTLNPGAVNISADYIAPGTTLYLPQVNTVGAPQNLGADYITPGTSLYEPGLDYFYRVPVDYIAPGTLLSEPSLAPGLVNLSVDYLAGTNLYEPGVSLGAPLLTIEVLAFDLKATQAVSYDLDITQTVDFDNA